jgi:hypothetical protein
MLLETSSGLNLNVRLWPIEDQYDSETSTRHDARTKIGAGGPGLRVLKQLRPSLMLTWISLKLDQKLSHIVSIYFLIQSYRKHVKVIDDILAKHSFKWSL